MKIETLHDVLYWTRESHRELSKCFKHCGKTRESVREQLLLDYLADHEKKLAKVITAFENAGNLITLNTWVCEYVERFPIVTHTRCEAELANTSTDEILEKMFRQHEEIIDLYKHLRSRVRSNSAEELINQLLSVEEHELLRMAQGANRLEDL